MTDPQPLDRTHPSISPTMEFLGQRELPTPDHNDVVQRVRSLHEALTVRKDATKPWGAGNRAPSRGLLVAAPTFHGKTYSIDKAIRSLTPVATTDGVLLAPKTLAFQCTSSAGGPAFLNDLLRAAEYPLGTRDIAGGSAASKLVQQLVDERFTMLWVDEFQYAVNPVITPGRSRVRDEGLVWSTIHSIVHHPVWPIAVVLSGLESAADSLNVNSPERAALRSRIKLRFIESLTADDAGNIKDIAEEYCKDAGVRSAFGGERNLLADKVLHASGFTFGIALELIKEAIARARLRQDRSLDPKDFAAVYWSWTSCADGANPFITPQWRQVDATLLHARMSSDRREGEACASEI